MLIIKISWVENPSLWTEEAFYEGFLCLDNISFCPAKSGWNHGIMFRKEDA